MSKNIRECTISAHECLWTGRNIKEIKKFFKLCDFDKYSLVKDNGDVLLYLTTLIEKNNVIIANKHYGIIGVFKDE